MRAPCKPWRLGRQASPFWDCLYFQGWTVKLPGGMKFFWGEEECDSAKGSHWLSKFLKSWWFFSFSLEVERWWIWGICVIIQIVLCICILYLYLHIRIIYFYMLLKANSKCTQNISEKKHAKRMGVLKRVFLRNRLPQPTVTWESRLDNTSNQFWWKISSGQKDECQCYVWFVYLGCGPVTVTTRNIYV